MPGRGRLILCAVLIGGPTVPVRAATADPAGPDASPLRLAPVQMFALADAALARERVDQAEALYRALLSNPDPEIRAEARFRLATILAKRGRREEAARLLREILDEKPEAHRVRLELAALLDAIGDEAGARKALREAQAAGLPPDVARFVDRYAAALRARKRFGISADIAIAPDSNVNRATRSDRLGTVIGDFNLDPETRQQSGVGLALASQIFLRTRSRGRANLILRGSGTASLYRDSRWNDVGATVGIGPELRLGDERLTLEANLAGRWFGGRLYSTTTGITATWLHPLGRTAQLRSSISLGRVDSRQSALFDGTSLLLSTGWERALSARGGIGTLLTVERQALGDPAWSTSGGSISAFGYRDIGRLTGILNLQLGHLEADARLSLLPRRRIDTSFRASATIIVRRSGFGRFAPLLRLTAERNDSSVEIYAYRRVRAEVGITRAF